MAITITTDIGAFLPQRNPMALEMGADASWQTYGTYFIELDLEVEEVYNSGTYVAQGVNARLYPNQAGTVLISVSGLLAGIFEDDRLDWGGQVAAIGDGMLRKYRYVVSDYGDGALLSSQASSTKVVVNAGLPRQQENTFVADWVTPGKFLTHQPRVKAVRRHQTEYLYFPLPGNDTFQMQVELVHEDQTTTLWLPGYTWVGDVGEIFIIPCGYDQLNIEAQASDVVAWKVRMIDLAGDPASEDMEYQIDQMWSELDRYFYFENSLGAWDTLRTTGQMSKRQLELSAVEGITTSGVISDPMLPTTLREQVSSYEVITQATGFGANVNIFDFYRDFLRTRKAYRIGSWAPNLSADGSNMIPIQILTGRGELSSDDSFGFGLEFTYREAFENVG